MTITPYLLHEIERFNNRDKFFIVGMNPDNSGGGIIGSRTTWKEAVDLKIEAIKANYSKVSILTADEFWGLANSHY